MSLNLFFLIIGFAFIFWGAQYLINAVVFLSRKLGISTMVIGLTVVAFGTSAPELFVGIWSAIKGDPMISLGNVLGANLANIGLIIGLTALIQPVKVKTSSLKKEFPFVILAPVMLYLLAMDGILSRLDGIILLIMAFLFIYYAIWSAGQNNGELINKIRALKQAGDGKTETVRQFFFLILGLILLILGAKFIVSSAVSIAGRYGVNEIVIGVTLITMGTALPELFASITALIKQRAEISFGNVIGSTIFNIFVILGVVLMITPIIVPAYLINFDLLFLILFTLILVTLLRASDRMVRIEGAVLLLSYIGYIAYLVYTG